MRAEDLERGIVVGADAGRVRAVEPLVFLVGVKVGGERADPRKDGAPHREIAEDQVGLRRRAEIAPRRVARGETVPTIEHVRQQRMKNLLPRRRVRPQQRRARPRSPLPARANAASSSFQ